MHKIDKYNIWIVIAIVVSLVSGCKDNEDDILDPIPSFTSICDSSTPVGTDYQIQYPFYVQAPIIPASNPMKEEAIELGRYLFWETKLSANNTQACASCHLPQAAFSDQLEFSTGIDGVMGDRNSMALINLAFVNNGFFWDSRSETLEEQILEPVINPIEMHNTWTNAINDLETDTIYPPLFEAAFGSDCIDSVRSAKAIAQFIRTMNSFNSRFDKYKVGQVTFTDSELLALDIWNKEGGDPEFVANGQFGADCFHCHPIAGGQLRDNFFHNNGLDSVFTDLGRYNVTGMPSDSAKFKVPTLRNIEFTAPYMHDGRFATLEEVIDHYNTGGHTSSTIDPFMKNTSGGLDLSPTKKQALLDFLLSLSDDDFITNPAFSDPH